MYKPSFRIRLKEDSFYPDKFACLGSQLIIIINYLTNILGPHTWYGANIKVTGGSQIDDHFSAFNLNKIGNDLSLIKICSLVDQFLEGIFFAIDEKPIFSNLDTIKVDTEDEPYRHLNIDGVMVEIRAFDTAFFELFSENEQIIKKLALAFNAQIEINPNFIVN